MNIGKVSANEEASMLISRCDRDRRARATRTEHQIDSLIGDAARAGDVLKTERKREAVLERTTHQYRTAVGRCALDDADLQVRRHIGILPVRLDNPGSLGVGVNDIVNAAVVLHRRGIGLEGGFAIVPAPYERKAMGPIG